MFKGLRMIAGLMSKKQMFLNNAEIFGTKYKPSSEAISSLKKWGSHAS